MAFVRKNSVAWCVSRCWSAKTSAVSLATAQRPRPARPVAAVARLPGPAAPDQLHDLFRHTSRRLISLHCDGNDLGAEAPARLQASLGEFLAAAPALLDLSLAGCGLRCEHVRGLCFTSLTQATGRARQAAGSGADAGGAAPRGVLSDAGP